MPAKKNNFISKWVRDVVSVVFILFRLIPNFIFLIEHEAKQAGRSILLILFLYLLAGSLLMSIWGCILLMCFIYLISFQLSWFSAIFILIIINSLLMIIVGLLILRSANNISFPKTRNLLRNMNLKK